MEGKIYWRRTGSGIFFRKPPAFLNPSCSLLIFGVIRNHGFLGFFHYFTHASSPRPQKAGFSAGHGTGVKKPAKAFAGKNQPGPDAFGRTYR
jgi:hypothetical protein